MRKFLLLVTGLFVLNGTAHVFAQRSQEITDLQAEIVELQTTLQDKKAELADLRAEEEGFYTIETNTATYTFSNPRVDGELLLLDLDYTNDSKGALDIYNDLWMLQFVQEDDTSINQLWVNSENLEEIDGRRPLRYNMRIKSGATVELVVGLSRMPDFYGEPYYSDVVPAEDPEVIELEEAPVFDDLSPLIVRVDQYSSPTGQSEQIVIPLE